MGGRYRLTAPLGSGGMGTVWDGRDEVLRRPVAVKEVLPPVGLSDEERDLLVERTRREARAAAAVASPSVMTVFDVVEEGRRTWIVMERLPPRTLADVLREEGPLPPAEAAAVGLGVLDALDAAHAAGVLHRDVKPANVLWGPGGRVVLADFGIAQAVGETSITRTGTVLGSPAYLAPERARGAPAGPASDLWGLGALLFAAVQGHPPFERGDALATLTAVVSEEVPPCPRAGELRPAVEGLLRKDPAQRMTSAQVRPVLQHAVRGRSARTVPGPLPGPLPGPASPHAAAVAAGAAAGAPSASSTQPLPLAQVRQRAQGRVQGRVQQDPAASAPRRPRAVVPLVLAGALGAGALAVLLQQGPDDPGAAPAGGASASAPAAPADPDGQAAAPGGAAPGAQDPAATGGKAQEPAATGGKAQEEAAKSREEAGKAQEEEAERAEEAVEKAEEGERDGGEPATGSRGSGSPTADAQRPRQEGAAGLPAGWERHTDDSGFSIGVPAGWSTERKGSRVYLRDPDSSRYLLVDQTDDPEPDALADWEAVEPAIAERLDGYRRVRLERVDVGYAEDAADLEFRHGRDGRVHVLDRNLITGPDRAYALYWSAPHASWPQERELFDDLAATFTPAGG
ncbi:hypothetical protein NUM3379_32540 [Kineococcus sp. NUM-3379]